MAASAFITQLAKKLAEVYALPISNISDNSDLILDEDKLAGALELFQEHHLLTSLLSGNGAVTNGIVSDVIKGIKEVQEGTKKLKADGVLGERTLQWLGTHKFGHYDRDIKTLPKSSEPLSPTTPGLHALRYFIVDSELPHIPGLDEDDRLHLLSNAFAAWSKVCNLVVRQTFDRTNANVIVSVEVLKEPSSVLAIADVGPPGKNQLDLKFDKAESWTPKVFQATACHEIGHIIGIHHSDVTGAGQLMNDTLQDDILVPQTEDKAAARKIWGDP